MRKIRVYQVDAFTDKKFSGNPAGVVLDADHLSTAEMQKIARELNNTETAFGMSADGIDHDINVRFFTPTTEVPMCGHNTIALHATRVMIGDCVEGSYVQKTKAGLVPIKIQRMGERLTVTMTQFNPRIDKPLKLDEAELLLKALGISDQDLQTDCPMQVVSTGNRKLFIAVKNKEILHALKPDMRALANLGKQFDCTGYYVFTIDAKAQDAFTHGRMFAPQIGIEEDPVTGTAIAPLGIYLLSNQIAHTNRECFEFTAKQGEAMGRPGSAFVKVFLDEKSRKPERVEVSGEAVIVFATELEWAD